ncbi:GntR family transcriptional regulator [Streptomyces sp. 8N616]|uniref:GntR family transcriptional regulator n=1 Tax=Streptomyces sp. 8N616 TaxID=3457414 RepID=UPI003FD68851
MCATHLPPGFAGDCHRINSIISAAFNYAISWGWVERNPAEYAHLPKLRRKRARPPAPEKVAQLLNLAFERDPDFGLVLWLLITTGARRGEICQLRWPYVNLQLCEVVIEENYVVAKGEKKVKETKTDDPRRLTLDSATVSPWRSLRTVAGRLGHADGGATTLRFYADWIRPADREAAEKIGALIRDLRDKAASDPALAVPPPRRKLAGASEILAAALRKAIADGVYPVGGKLPKVVKLAEQYNLGYGTAQQAITLLRNQGLVESGKGRPTRVVKAPEVS